eukprot:3368588-Pleurochrysis_carterae.AAC.6
MSPHMLPFPVILYSCSTFKVGSSLAIPGSAHSQLDDLLRVHTRSRPCPGPARDGLASTYFTFASWRSLLTTSNSTATAEGTIEVSWSMATLEGRIPPVWSVHSARAGSLLNAVCIPHLPARCHIPARLSIEAPRQALVLWPASQRRGLVRRSC